MFSKSFSLSSSTRYNGRFNKKKNLKEKIEVDSCGTSDVESGSLPHEKIIEICKKKNIECNQEK